LSAEDPLLCAQWNKAERELCVHIMGTIQLEILQSMILERYNIRISFGKPSVIYKETITKPAMGHVDYTMPKPCWAIMDFELTPAPKGSGVHFESAVRDDQIFYRYQSQVRQAIPDALRQGMFGWEVTDLNIRLVAGNHHTVHTHPLDFIVATPMGIMDGLRKAEPILLEPMLSVSVSVPEELGNRIIRDFMQMRGEYDTPVIRDGRFLLEGLLPAATSLEYPVELAAFSSGRGMISMHVSGYRPCPPELGATANRRGVNPLDKAKFILWIRGALENGTDSYI